MFIPGDRVKRKDGLYTGVVVGYCNKNPTLLRVKRDDGKTGNYGDFWQTEEWNHELDFPLTLENE